VEAARGAHHPGRQRVDEHPLVADAGMLRGDLLRHLVPEHVAESGGVGLRRARDDAAPRLGLLERVVQHPLDTGASEDARLDRHPVLRHHPAVLMPVGRAPGQVRPLNRDAERVDGLARLGDNLRPHAVSGEERDPVRHATPTRSGTVSRYASASSTDTTSAYLAWMSKRFASCGACARSPTHSRGTSVGQPYWSRSIAVARMHPLVVAPQRITEANL